MSTKRRAAPKKAASPDAPKPLVGKISALGYTFTLAELFPEQPLDDAANDRSRSADERLAALEAQHIAMRTGQAPAR